MTADGFTKSEIENTDLEFNGEVSLTDRLDSHSFFEQLLTLSAATLLNKLIATVMFLCNWGQTCPPKASGAIAVLCKMPFCSKIIFTMLLATFLSILPSDTFSSGYRMDISHRISFYFITDTRFITA